MNLTKELIRKLDKRSARAKPSLRMDGSFAEDHAFLFPELGKGFVFEKTDTKDKYAFTLIERKSKLDYSFCHARGFVIGYDEIVDLIIEWCDKDTCVEELSLRNSEMVPFKPLLPKHNNRKIEEAWVKVKNSTFNDTGFWKRIERLDLNDKIIVAAREMAEYENYFPFTSHDNLRFSIDEMLTETWALSLAIQPSGDFKKGNYMVSYKEDYNEPPEYFYDVKKALCFLNEKMLEQKPVKWK